MKQLANHVKHSKWKRFYVSAVCATLLLISLVLIGCGSQNSIQYSTQNDFLEKISSNDTVILYTNDIHGSALYGENCIGIDGLDQLKQATKEKTSNIILADAGDSYQGNYMCVKSKGEYMTKLMNLVGYNVACLGNHEFDFGIDNVCKLASQSSFPTLCCNLKYTGSNVDKSAQLQSIQPYIIVGDIGFVGVDTPDVITDATPGKYDEDGVCVYDMCQNNPQALYELVQKNIDECKAQGAQKIIILSHLGDYAKNLSEFSSDKLAENIKSCDVIIDAHAHSVINANRVKDISGKEIPVVSSGALLQNVGGIILHQNGQLDTYMISKVDSATPEITQQINDLKRSIDPEYDQVLATSNCRLEYKGNGNMVNSSREDELGNMLADAFKFAGKTDCGIINATSYRAGIPEGDITKEHITDLLPFKDEVVNVSMTGADIEKMLEKSCCKTQAQYEDENGNAVGSNANFLQVSGLKFDIDVSVPATQDASTKRVKNIMIQKGENDFETLDSSAHYTVATSAYLANGGCSMDMLKECAHNGTGIMDDDAVITYIKQLNGDLASNYSQTQGRINIINA